MRAVSTHMSDCIYNDKPTSGYAPTVRLLKLRAKHRGLSNKDWRYACKVSDGLNAHITLIKSRTVTEWAVNGAGRVCYLYNEEQAMCFFKKTKRLILYLQSGKTSELAKKRIMNILCHLVDWYVSVVRTQMTHKILNSSVDEWIRLSACHDWQRGVAAPKSSSVWDPLLGDFEHAGLTYKELLTSKELKEEGNRMHHCVGTYAEDCVSGYTRIFHVEGEGLPPRGATAELYNYTTDGWNIRQIYAVCNALIETRPRNHITATLCGKAENLMKMLPGKTVIEEEAAKFLYADTQEEIVWSE